MKQQTITLTCYKDGAPVDVEFTGHVCKGLLLHKDLQKQHAYTVSHIATGIPVLARFRVSRAKALDALEALAGVLDWTEQDPFQAHMSGLGQKVSEIAQSLY